MAVRPLVLLMALAAAMQCAGCRAPAARPPATRRNAGPSPELTCRGIRGETGLHLAAKRGDVALMERLVPAVLGVNVPDEGGTTPLHVAARYGRPVAARWLLDRGAEVNARTTSGETPLVLASRDASRPSPHTDLPAGP